MDAFTFGLWALRLAFVALLLVFFTVVLRTLWRDLRAAVAASSQPLGRLLVLSSPRGTPEPGSSIAVDVVTSLGRDVNNTVVVDAADVAPEHALLTFRGRVWYLEDLAHGGATWVNGQAVTSAVALGYGDEIRLGGSVRLRLERPSAPAGHA